MSTSVLQRENKNEEDSEQKERAKQDPVRVLLGCRRESAFTKPPTRPPRASFAEISSESLNGHNPSQLGNTQEGFRVCWLRVYGVIIRPL